MRIALDWPGSILVILGMTTGIVRVVAGPDRLKWLLATVFPLVYFKFLSGQNIIYGRYLLPLIPFLSLLAAAFIVWVVTWMRRTQMSQRVRNLATIGLTVVAMAPPAYTAIGYNANAARTWTNALAYNWIVQELPPGTTIRLEGSLAIKLPAAYKTSYAKELRLDAVDAYARSGIQYLVASSQCYGPYLGAPDRFPAEYAIYERIFSQTEEVARFMPSANHPGPELLILKVKP